MGGRVTQAAAEGRPNQVRLSPVCFWMWEDIERAKSCGHFSWVRHLAHRPCGYEMPPRTADRVLLATGLAASAVLPVLLWRSTSTSTSMIDTRPAVHLCQVRQYFALADCIARDPCAFLWCCGVPELRVAMIQPSFFRGYFKLRRSSSCWAKFEPWPDSYFQPWHFEPPRLSDM